VRIAPIKKKRAAPVKKPMPKFVVVVAYKERNGWYVSGPPIAATQSQATAVKEAGEFLAHSYRDGRTALVCEVIGVAKIEPSPALFVPIDKF
jgi:hypothetical protein